MPRNMAERPLILVVEDEYLLQADVLDALSEAGFEAEGVYSGEEALEALANRPYKVLITDANLGGGLTGWEVARRVREKDRAFPVIYLTAIAVAEWASEGVPDSILITKPYVTAPLVAAISRLLPPRIEAD
jgi:DNA-binding response OmpR family regulator